MSCDTQCSMALPRGAVGELQYVTVIIPDHTHLLLFVLITIDRRSHKGSVRDKLQKIDTIQCAMTNDIIVWTMYSNLQMTEN